MAWYVRNTVNGKHIKGKDKEGKLLEGGRGTIQKLIIADKSTAKEIRKKLNGFYDEQELLDKGWVVTEIK